jgi:acyl-CoA reductase-like NAD-dependent aldehyde dehydrogenase
MQKIVTLSDPSLFTDRCLVGGKWIVAEKGAAIEVANPATGEVLGGVPNCGRKETDEAIASRHRRISRSEDAAFRRALNGLHQSLARTQSSFIRDGRETPSRWNTLLMMT